MCLTQDNLRLSSIERGEAFRVNVDGEWLPAYRGETVATILLAAGKKTFYHAGDGSRRGLFCGIGQCFSCLVTINGNPNQRACMTEAAPDMYIQTIHPE